MLAVEGSAVGHRPAAEVSCVGVRCGQVEVGRLALKRPDWLTRAMMKWPSRSNPPTQIALDKQRVAASALSDDFSGGKRGCAELCCKFPKNHVQYFSVGIIISYPFANIIKQQLPLHFKTKY